MAQGRLIGGKKFLIHAHGVATEMGSKKWPKQADVMLLRQIKICKELTGHHCAPRRAPRRGMRTRDRAEPRSPESRRSWESRKRTQ